MNLISYVWQILQHIAALLVISYYKLTKGVVKVEDFKGRKIYIVRPSNMMTAVSFGHYIIMGSDYEDDQTKLHEYGHTIQSLWLGPLYLFTVGIVSALFNLISRANSKFAANYYNRWPENQADKLGGVKR